MECITEQFVLGFMYYKCLSIKGKVWRHIEMNSAHFLVTSNIENICNDSN